MDLNRQGADITVVSDSFVWYCVCEWNRETLCVTALVSVTLFVCVWLEARIPPKPNEAVDHHSVSSSINPQAGPMFCGSEPALISQTHWSTTAQSNPAVQYRAPNALYFLADKGAAGAWNFEPFSHYWRCNFVVTHIRFSWPVRFNSQHIGCK